MDAVELLKTAKSFAVIGLSDDPNKYSYQIYQRLLDCGYETYGISPHLTEFLGKKVYVSLNEIPSKVEVAVFVVSPKYGYEYLKQCQQLGISYLWMQPGTYDDELIKAIEASGLTYYLDCILRRTPTDAK